MTPRGVDVTISALAVCLGIEALIVLRDLCGLMPARAKEVSRWTVRALVRQSLVETGRRGRR